MIPHKMVNHANNSYALHMQIVLSINYYVNMVSHGKFPCNTVQYLYIIMGAFCQCNCYTEL